MNSMFKVRAVICKESIKMHSDVLLMYSDLLLCSRLKGVPLSHQDQNSVCKRFLFHIVLFKEIKKYQRHHLILKQHHLSI